MDRRHIYIYCAALRNSGYTEEFIWAWGSVSSLVVWISNMQHHLVLAWDQKSSTGSVFCTAALFLRSAGPAQLWEAAPEKGPNKSHPFPGCQSHTGIVLGKESWNMRQRFLNLTFYPTHKHLPCCWPSEQQTPKHLPWRGSILCDTADLTEACCDLVRVRKDRRVTKRFQVAWGRSYGVAIPGDGSMTQDCQQYHHQTHLGWNQAHEQCCWILLNADLLLCVSTSGPTHRHLTVTSVTNLLSAILSQEDLN